MLQPVINPYIVVLVDAFSDILYSYCILVAITRKFFPRRENILNLISNDQMKSMNNR